MFAAYSILFSPNVVIFHLLLFVRYLIAFCKVRLKNIALHTFTSLCCCCFFFLSFLKSHFILFIFKLFSSASGCQWAQIVLGVFFFSFIILFLGLFFFWVYELYRKWRGNGGKNMLMSVHNAWKSNGSNEGRSENDTHKKCVCVCARARNDIMHIELQYENAQIFRCH